MNLSSIQTPEGLFTIAAFDHRGSLAKMFGLDPAAKETGEVLSQLKTLFMEAFSPICSGVLVDPEYGFPAIAHKAKNTGLILSLESSGNESRSALPTLIPNWGVENVKNNYAVAKLLINYHPAEPNAEAKKKLVMELGEYCHHEEIAFLLEPIIFNPQNEKEELTARDFQEAQLVMIQDFQAHCDVIKLQYPGDALAAATVTAALDIPWILLSRAMPYEQFKSALQVCMENGAKGFAVGRAVWQEMGKLDMAKIKEFLLTTGVQRMQELIQIAKA